MSARTKLRDDFDAAAVCGMAKASKEAAQTRRLMTIASLYGGASHLEAARTGGVTPQIVRDWIVRFNARGEEGLITGRTSGNPSKLTADHRRALAKMVEDGPDPAVHGVVRWRLKDLAAWLAKEHGIALDETTIGRALKALGYRKLSARPRTLRRMNTRSRILKKLPGRGRGRQDKAPQHDRDRGVVPRRGARRPEERHHAALGQERHTAIGAARSAHRLGLSVRRHLPEAGKAAGLVLPRCTTAAMNAHLLEISQAVAPGAHAILILDKAGWHTTAKLVLPANISLLPLPPRCPELNPTEQVFAKLKALLRKAAERTIDGLWTSIGQLLDLFTPKECANYFAAAGYEPD